MRKILFLMIAAATAVAAVGCGDDDGGSDNPTGGAGGAGGNGTVDEAQVPPAGDAAAVQAWITKGAYKSWHCEDAPHPQRTVSPHGINRICSNDLLSAHGTGEYPVDASGVKELYDAAGTSIVGYAVYRHVKAGTTGDSWYWYEKVPLDSMAPHDPDGIVADGTGDKGPAQTICVGCHGAAGVDADHPGHDLVYTQVQ